MSALTVILSTEYGYSAQVLTSRVSDGETMVNILSTETGALITGGACCTVQPPEGATDVSISEDGLTYVFIGDEGEPVQEAHLLPASELGAIMMASFLNGGK